MEEEGIKREKTTLELGLDEAVGILASLSLTSVTIGDFLVIMRSNFDLTISGEPYIGLVMLLNLKDGTHLSRIWNQTVASGNVEGPDQFREVCKSHFGRGRPCLGCPEEEGDTLADQEFLISQTPIPRKISTTCHKLLGEDAGDSVSSCSECVRLADSSSLSATDEQDEMEEHNDIEAAFSPTKRRRYDEEDGWADNVDFFTEDVPSADDFGDLKEDLLLPEIKIEEKDYSVVIKTEKKDDSVVGSARPVRIDRSVRFVRLPDDLVKCVWCDFTGKEGQTGYHQMNAHYWGNFRCPTCGPRARFGFAKDLVDHIREAQHPGDSEVACPRCSDKFPAFEIASHYEDCVKDKSKAKKQLLAENHRKGIRFKVRHHCSPCDISFKRSDELDRHRRDVHGNTVPSRYTETFECDKCGFTTPYPKSFERHQNRMYPCDRKIGVGISQKYLLEELKESAKMEDGDVKMAGIEEGDENSETPEIMGCPICNWKSKVNLGDKAKEKARLLRHLMFIHSFGLFRCLQCGTEAEYPDDLLDHMRKEDHTKDPFTQCPSCAGKIHMNEIKQHYKECLVTRRREDGKARTKIKQKEWSQSEKQKERDKEKVACTECGKMINRKTFKFHYKIHLRERGVSEEEAKTQLFFYCDICGVKLTSEKSLALHKRNIHFPKPTPCTVCAEVFPSYHKMRDHRDSVHNTLQCEFCEFQTGRPHHLKKHMAKHFEPQFQCSHCEKKLKSKQSLTAHEMEHTGERPYKCDVCGGGFKSTSALIIHKQGVHKVFGPKSTKDASTVNRKRIRK